MQEKVSQKQAHPSDEAPQRSVVVIGNFDGVHLGHQALLAQAKAVAEAKGLLLSVLTFTPHPRLIFQPETPEFRLMTQPMRCRYLHKFGVDHVVEQPFTFEFAALSAQEFVTRCLVSQLHAAHVFVGADFRFGHGRKGDVTLLHTLGQQFGFDVSAVDLVGVSEQHISSTAVRTALRDGRVDVAAACLGRPHFIHGPVLHGEKRGRELGFPTANMSLDGVIHPKYGVYAVWVEVETGPYQGRYQGAASIGVRPMFGENVANCETYIFDFKGDLYGADLCVSLISYLRPEMKFDGLDALITQMNRDCQEARVILSQDARCQKDETGDTRG